MAAFFAGAVAAAAFFAGAFFAAAFFAGALFAARLAVALAAVRGVSDSVALRPVTVLRATVTPS